MTREAGTDVYPSSAVERVPRTSPFPLVALVLGIAGATLAVTVIWCYAAIPLGVAALATGIIGLRHADPAVPHLRTRATIGAVLGAVALALGLAGAYFFPRFLDRADNFFGAVQTDVDTNVQTINAGLRDDVRSLDRTLTRDLRRFEEQNRADLAALEQRTSTALAELERRIDTSAADAESSARRDLVTLEAALREDIRAIEAAIRTTDQTVSTHFGSIEQRVADLERRLREAVE